jgi:hypothetical protein
MKIFELLGQQNQTAKETKTVTDVVAQEVVPEQIDGTIIEHDDHSAITEGVSQILRRVKGKGIQKGSGPVSRRLKGAQIKTSKSGRGGPGSRPIRSFSRPFIKSKIVRPKKK